MQIIIFSYNRAMQLEALLQSINKYWDNNNYQIDVLYNTSSNKYQEAYDLLKQKAISLWGGVSFYKENNIKHISYTFKELTDYYNLKLLYLCPFLRHAKSDFRKQLLNILKQSHAKQVIFLTDDSIFIKPIRIKKEDVEWINKDPFHRQISMRHGIETLGNKKLKETPSGYEWDFSQYSSNDHWGYRFSLDAHIYNREAMLKALSSISFSNPNTLESSGMLHYNKKGVFNEGRCNSNMSILSFPINIVQTTFKNEALNASPETLNDYYLKGYHINYPIPEQFSSFQIYPDKIILCKGEDKIVFNIKES